MQKHFRVWAAGRVWVSLLIQAARLIDPNLAFAGDSQILGLFLRVITQRRRAAQVATGAVRARAAVIDAKENMSCVITHTGRALY